ncbi:60S ribosomal protein L31 [Galemys pyrenaicus]|uniref:60S ribosomal protein L31 n=1 Tax=Galemys pyrenaicus TaxID=202257 RepID=A0A8J6AF22_GALPY|nr:60S ribosomal protein L31 [Galemys pyrenaicus]
MYPLSGLQEVPAPALKEIQKFAMKEIGILNVCFDTKLNKAIWPKEQGLSRSVYVWLSRKCNMNKESPNKLHTLINYCYF